MIHRRKLLTGLAGLIAAPAIVRFDSIMPVRALRPGGWNFLPSLRADEVDENFASLLRVLTQELAASMLKDPR